MEKLITLNITDLDYLGFGIAHGNNETFFVQNALPCETALCEVLYKRNNINYAKVVELNNISTDRITPPCPYFLSCGGCSLQHLNYEKALIFKQNLIKNAFKKICGEEVSVFPCEKSSPYFYRNKMAMPIREINHKPVLTMFQYNTHKAIKIKDCLIQNESFKFLIEVVNKFLIENNVKAYNDETNDGDFKFLVARIIKNQIEVTFVVTKKVNLNFHPLFNDLKQKFDKVGINLNINNLKNNVILTDNLIHVLGEKQIEINKFGLNFSINNLSFLQINDEIQDKIYGEVLKNIENECVVNAYSGAGLLTAILSKAAKEVFGIEIVKSAHLSAEKLMQNNDIKNVKNLCGDANFELAKISRTLKDYILVVDPPRKGLDERVLGTILKTLPRRIIYISCSPTSFAKNYNMLKEKYVISKIQPFDMFPQTPHVETLLVLNRK